MDNSIEQLIEKENLINKYLKECIDIIYKENQVILFGAGMGGKNI